MKSRLCAVSSSEGTLTRPKQDSALWNSLLLYLYTIMRQAIRSQQLITGNVGQRGGTCQLGAGIGKEEHDRARTEGI
jgi:hypothetical protein